MDSGLLVLRIGLGLLMAAHGAQKLFGWFGGHGLNALGGYFETLGFRPGRAFAALASVGELASGILVALGLFGPVGPALMLSVMIVAAVSAHLSNGLFAMTNGVEVPLLYGIGALTLALTGPGAVSLDALFGLSPLFVPTLKIGALLAGLLGAAGNLALRRVPAPAPTTT